MQERFDNLKTEVIEDKKEYISNVVAGYLPIDKIISVNVISFGVDILNNMSTESVLSQITDNRYVWIKKTHE